MSILGEQFLHVLVDSKKRLTGTTSNFTYHIEFPADQEYNRVVVQQVLIPQTFYLFQADTNEFLLWEDDNTYSIRIPVGNYTKEVFATTVMELLNQYTYEYTISYDAVNKPQTEKFTITVKDRVTPLPPTVKVLSSQGEEELSPVECWFEFTNVKAAEVFGFQFLGNYIFENGLLKPPYCYNFNVEQSFLILSDLVANNVLIEVLDVGIGLGSISFTSNDLEAYSRKFKKISSNAYTFVLTNEDDTNIDLNGSNMLFSLLFYKSDNTNQLQRDNLLLKHLSAL